MKQDIYQYLTALEDKEKYIFNKTNNLYMCSPTFGHKPQPLRKDVEKVVSEINTIKDMVVSAELEDVLNRFAQEMNVAREDLYVTYHSSWDYSYPEVSYAWNKVEKFNRVKDYSSEPYMFYFVICKPKTEDSPFQTKTMSFKMSLDQIQKNGRTLGENITANYSSHKGHISLKFNDPSQIILRAPLRDFIKTDTGAIIPKNIESKAFLDAVNDFNNKQCSMGE